MFDWSTYQMIDLCKRWIFHMQSVSGNAMQCRVVQNDLHNINTLCITQLNITKCTLKSAIIILSVPHSASLLLSNNSSWSIFTARSRYASVVLGIVILSVLP